MQLEAIKVFCDLVHFRSFSKAAEENGLSQPTVSRLIHQLESRLGDQLIDRSRRPLQLTPLGQSYYEGCKDILEQYMELEASLRRTQEQRVMTVRVAAIYSVGLGDMGQFVERFHAQNPQARVHMDYLHPDQVYQRVREGTADLGLVSFPARSRELTVLPWREEDMVLACAPSHGLGQRHSLRPAQLDGQKYVAFDRGLMIRREVDRFLREQGATVEIVFEFDNIENIKKAVQIGAGVALLPEPTLRQELQAGSVLALRLEGARLVRPIGIIHRKQHRLSRAAQAFIDLLREHGSSPSAGNGKRTRSSRTASKQPTP